MTGTFDEVSEKGYATALAAPLTQQMLLDAMQKVRGAKDTAHGFEDSDPHLLYPDGTNCVLCGKKVR